MKACLTWHADFGWLEVSDLAWPHAPLDGMLNWPAKPNWSLQYNYKKKTFYRKLYGTVPGYRTISNQVARPGNGPNFSYSKYR